MDSDGTLIAQELEYGFDRGALKAVQEYFSERGKSWEPTKEELKLWGMEEREYPPLYRQTIEFAMQHGEVDAFWNPEVLILPVKMRWKRQSARTLMACTLMRKR